MALEGTEGGVEGEERTTGREKERTGSAGDQNQGCVMCGEMAMGETKDTKDGKDRKSWERRTRQARPSTAGSSNRRFHKLFCKYSELRTHAMTETTCKKGKERGTVTDERVWD
jgi:hypothetical protein